MRTPQKKLAALLLLWAAVIIFQVVWVAEPWRLSAAEDSLREEQVARGAQLYAENCVICHGPAGEGVIGLPVNRPEWRAEEMTELEREQVAAMLTNVLERGRGGSDTPSWEFERVDGELQITSRTRMPAWGQDAGGPLNEQQIQDLVVFLMNYDEWETGVRGIPPANLTRAVQREVTDEQGRTETVTEDVPITFEDLPEARGVSQQVNDEARRLLMADQGACVTCHTFGDFGGFVGPNLTVVGEWTTPEFLRQWLRDPEGTIPRMPTVWLGNGVEKRVPEDIEIDWTGIHATRMPDPTEDLGLSEEQVEVLVSYLSGLRRD